MLFLTGPNEEVLPKKLPNILWFPPNPTSQIAQILLILMNVPLCAMLWLSHLEYSTQSYRTSRASHHPFPSPQFWVYYNLQDPISCVLGNLELEWRMWCWTFNFFFNKFIYLFIYFWLCWVFISVRGLSPVVASGGHSSLRCAGLSLSRPLVAEYSLQTRRLSSCGSRAQLLRGTWDLPRPGLEPVSPASAGRLSTTAPPGKPRTFKF